MQIKPSLFIIIFLLLFGCKNETESREEKCIAMILSQPGIQPFLHPELEGRIPIVILKNEYTKSCSNFFQAGKYNCMIVDLEDLATPAFFEFTRKKFSSFGVEFNYNVEGLSGSVDFIQCDQAICIENFEIYEN
jgi:hypothetical protein